MENWSNGSLNVPYLNVNNQSNNNNNNHYLLKGDSEDSSKSSLVKSEPGFQDDSVSGSENRHPSYFNDISCNM